MSKIIQRTSHTASRLHIREGLEGAESRTIVGHAILFNTPSAPFYDSDDEQIREIIAPSAITMELLNASDIKMTMFHDNHVLLARSNRGEGTLSYTIDDDGVAFEFEAPRTIDGDKALELVRRGDIAGCSFAFSTEYYDEDFVSRSVTTEGGKTITTYCVNRMTGIYDFTLTPDPAYPDTSCEVRSIVEAHHKRLTKAVEQTAEMRDKSTAKLIV